MKFYNYIFDLGGVLLDINMQLALEGFRKLGVPENELRFDVGETASIMQQYQLGNLTTDEFCDSIIARCNTTSTAKEISKSRKRQEVANAWNSICQNIPEQKMKALRILKQKAKVYLLSNTNDLHWKFCLNHWLNAGEKKPDDFFHGIFLSQELHLEKPNPEIFRQVLRKISTADQIPNAENTVFLDDNLANVESARRCGISSIHVTPDFDWVSQLP